MEPPYVLDQLTDLVAIIPNFRSPNLMNKPIENKLRLLIRRETNSEVFGRELP